MGNSFRSTLYRSRLCVAVVLLIYIVIAGAVIWQTETTRIRQERARVSYMAGERALAIQATIEEAMSSAYALASMVQLTKGNLKEFERLANTLRAFYPGISALELAPGGVIRHIIPLKGNEKAIGHNLLTDPTREKEALLARDSHKLTLAGPFQLIQGGLGAAGRLPVFISDDKGVAQFWGFVVVLIRFPETLSPARLSELVDSGYDYEIWRVHPDTGKKHIIDASSGRNLINPVERTVEVPNATWTLSVAPVNGWFDTTALSIKIAMALFIAIIVIIMTVTWRQSHPG